MVVRPQGATHTELSRATLGEVLPRHPLLAGATGRAQGLPLGGSLSLGAPNGPLVWEITRPLLGVSPSEFAGVSLLAATRGGFLKAASNQRKELCILLMCVQMGLLCCSESLRLEGPRGRALCRVTFPFPSPGTQGSSSNKTNPKQLTVITHRVRVRQACC